MMLKIGIETALDLALIKFRNEDNRLTSYKIIDEHVFVYLSSTDIICFNYPI